MIPHHAHTWWFHTEPMISRGFGTQFDRLMMVLGPLQVGNIANFCLHDLKLDGARTLIVPDGPLVSS